VLTLCSLCWERERMCCWLEAVKLLESRSCRMMVELLVAEDAVGVDHDPESRQIVSCYCLETINKEIPVMTVLVVAGGMNVLVRNQVR
jgi:hypothetical protein